MGQCKPFPLLKAYGTTYLQGGRQVEATVALQKVWEKLTLSAFHSHMKSSGGVAISIQFAE